MPRPLLRPVTRWTPRLPWVPPVAHGIPASNFDYFIQGLTKRPVVRCYLEGVPDVLCTEEPPDRKSKTYALSFGLGDYAAAAADDLVETGDITVCAWVKIETPAASARTYFAWAGTDEGWKLQITSLDEIAVAAGNLSGGLSSITLTQTVKLEKDLWHYIAIAIGGEAGYDVRGVVLTMEADGTITERTMQGSEGSSVPTRGTRTGWGHDYDAILGDGTNPMLIASCSVFDRCLSLSEMRRIAFRRLDSSWPMWSSLRAQWWLDEGDGTRILDDTGNYELANGDGTSSQEGAWEEDAPFAIAYRPIGVISSIGQAIDPRATSSTVSGVSFVALDTDEWLTAVLAQIGYRLRNRSAYVFLGFDGLLEDEYELVMAGAIEQVRPLPGRGYEIRIGDAKRFAKERMQIARQKLDGAINNSVTMLQLDSVLGFATTTGAQVGNGTDPAGVVKIDNEIIIYEDATGDDLDDLTRGALGSAAAAHDSGATVEEIILLRDIHPIDVALYLLLSGMGNDHNGSGYDRLARFTSADATTNRTTAGRGAGIAVSDIDIDQWESQKATYWASGYNGSFLIDHDIDDIKDYIERQILRPLGAFLYVSSGGKLRIGAWKDRAAAADARKILQAQQARPIPSVDFSRVINSISVRWHKIAGTSTFLQINAYEDLDSGDEHGRSETMQLDSDWIREDDFGSGTTFTPDTILNGFKSTMFDRFGDELYVVEVTCGLRFWDVELDDIVLLQHAHLPDFVLGWRGLQDVEFQVVGRKLDIRRGQVVLRLVRMP